MNKAVALLLLCLLGFSLFVLVVAPIEIYQTLAARNWEPVAVKITASRIKEISNRFHLELRIEEQQSKRRSANVSIRYGDLPLSFVAFGGLFASSLYADRDKYPPGATVTAYRSPDRSAYVFEQNSVNLMLWLLAFACIYPAIAAWSLIRNAGRNRSSRKERGAS